MQQDHSPASETRSDDSNRIFVKAWLSSTVNERPLDTLDSELEENMAPAVQCRDETGTVVTASSKSSAKSSVSAYDVTFGRCLGYRNIYVESEAPPISLLKRAEEIIEQLRSSPEIDEVSAQELTATAKRLRRSAEDDIVQDLGIPLLISRLKTLSDQRVSSVSGQPWINFVPVPLDASISGDEPPLAKPKPDKSFGYSSQAFTRDQRASIRLLTNPSTGASYVMPYEDLYFPFLNFEYKSQVKGGSMTVATDQAANAGAVVGHGLTELAQRASEWKSLDYNEPQFFSIVMDHKLVQINVHWLRHNASDGQFSFHVHELSEYLLRDPNTIGIIQRAVKNIVDWGLQTRLPMICKELDAYREKLSRENAEAEKAASERAAAGEAATEVSAAETPKTKRANKQGQKRKSPVQKRKSFVQKRNGTTAAGVTVPPLNA